MANKKIMTGVRFDPDLHERIRKLAYDEKKSMNALIIEILELYLRIEK